MQIFHPRPGFSCLATRKSFQMVKSLKVRNETYITKLENGSGVVILGMLDYINTMEIILNDLSKFLKLCLLIRVKILIEMRLKYKSVCFLYINVDFLPKWCIIVFDPRNLSVLKCTVYPMSTRMSVIRNASRLR